MKRTISAISTTLAAAVSMSAAQPVASVTSSASFAIHGSEVNTDGVPTWPVMAGDEIAARSAPVLLEFRDGSRIRLEGNSTARVEATKEGLILRLLSGALMVASLPAKPSLQFYSLTQPAKPIAGQVVTVASTTPAAAPEAVPHAQTAALPLPKPISHK